MDQGAKASREGGGGGVTFQGVRYQGESKGQGEGEGGGYRGNGPLPDR